MSPKTTLKKNLLLLNNELPYENGSIWVTTKELYDRLIHSGVNPSLEFELVKDAVKRFNIDEKYLAVRFFNGVPYYRSKMCHLQSDSGDIPSRQLFKKNQQECKKGLLSIQLGITSKQPVVIFL